MISGRKGVAALALVVLVAGCGGSESIDGAAVFGERCAGCHGAAGEGGMGPALRGQATFEIVTQGRPSLGMPPFGGTLSDEQIEAVVAYANEDLG